MTYTYGTSGTSKGRPIHISDGTGSHELTYDALGNVTAETRIIVLPNSQEEFSLRRGGCSVAPCCSRWSGFAVQPNSVTGFAICIIENTELENALFEVASAIGTVGLTLNFTTTLSNASRIILIILMFLGRVGGLTFIYSVLPSLNKEHGFIAENIAIG